MLLRFINARYLLGFSHCLADEFSINFLPQICVGSTVGAVILLCASVRKTYPENRKQYKSHIQANK